MGFRIVVESDCCYESLLEEIKTASSLTVPIFRPYVREEGGYSAIHIYVTSKDNSYLP